MTRLACMLDMWLFEHLTVAERQRLESLTARRSYLPGQMLFHQGDPVAGVFLLTSGRARLFKISPEGKEVTLGFLEPHDLFGEETLFREGRRAFNAQALMASTVCACEKSDFEALAQHDPGIAAKVMQALGEKLSRMSEQLTDLALYDVPGRVARVLDRLAQQYGQPTARGLRIEPRITHEELAALVGASRVMVTHALQTLRQSGSLSLDHSRHFVIRSRQALAEQMPTDEQPMHRGCACFQDSDGAATED